VNIIVDISAV